MTDHPVIPIQYLPICAGIAIKYGMKQEKALEAITINPAKVLGIEDRVGSIEVGKDADIVIFNPKKTYQIDKNNFASKGRNTPFDGRTVTGEVEYTICGGKMIYEKEMTGEKA